MQEDWTRRDSKFFLNLLQAFFENEEKYPVMMRCVSVISLIGWVAFTEGAREAQGNVQAIVSTAHHGTLLID
ncbi:hypothetical protein GHA01_27410 [Novacetimonas hansenii]|uniref:Uncharacterized protein n=1 Tax=Novacetimonas hansenii TaxID=436 RepID=A0ABQ0SK20_NOVHA|nr:hypothetical protein Gaha_0158_021 [Novacetimonas hansenii JCM 7643]GEC64892.1 hypothetical protein GHA01_27410 [Novacetimonas hansenii]